MHNQYEVIGIVGEGAYGIVYKCKNKETGEFVAIKKFKEIQDDIVKKTMARELRVLKMVKNDNIVEYKGAFKRKENLFLVFEYVEKNLLELLQEHQKGLEPNLIKKIIYQLCKAINYLHEQNIVHRDIKPENLLIDSSNKLKLCDFGFARSFKNTRENLTDYVATRWYRSPELLLTSGLYGPEVDIWSIGCIMGELTDGDPLFPGDDEVHQLIVIQKVIGRFADEQYEQFAKNPHFSGCKLPEVTKPETLERRYMGKLGKQAISFMKALLHPDPKQRLKGDDIFKHPYFENYADPFPGSTTTNLNPNNTNSTRELNERIVKKDSLSNVNIVDRVPQQALSQGTAIHPNIINKSISIGRDTIQGAVQNKQLGSQNHSVEKSNEKDYKDYNSNEKKKYHFVGGGTQQSNPTNINIINYNSNTNGNSNSNGNASNLNYHNYNSNVNNLSNYPESNLEKFDKLEKLEKEKSKKFTSTLNNFSYMEVPGQHQHHSLSKGKVPSNKNSKNFASQDNLMMTSHGFNKNLKDNILSMYGATASLDSNFKTFYKGDNKYNYDIDMNFKREERKNNSLKKDHSNNKNKSKNNNKDIRYKPNNVIPEEGYDNNGNSLENPYINKVSPPKYGTGYHPNNFKTKNSFYQNNLQLPSIGTMKTIKKPYK